MIDRGLLATMAVIVVLVSVLDRRVRRRSPEEESILALATTPLLVGLAIGRLAAVSLDDPATLRRPSDFLLLRGGVEFWAGVLAATIAVWARSPRQPRLAVERLAQLAPFALWAYAAYEAACLLRDGCFGPRFPLGLEPGGHGARQVPIGILVGIAVGAVGMAAWRSRDRFTPALLIALSTAGLAAVRAVAGFSLPRVGQGLTRPHRESVAVLAAAGAASVWLFARRLIRRRAGTTTPGTSDIPAPRATAGGEPQGV